MCKQKYRQTLVKENWLLIDSLAILIIFSFDSWFRARRKLISASVLCLVFMVAEVVGGVLSNSLAIATDAAHLLTGNLGSFLIFSRELHWSFPRLCFLHDILVCHLDGSQTQEPEDVIWLAQSRGVGGDSVSSDDLGGDGGPGLHGSPQDHHQGVRDQGGGDVDHQWSRCPCQHHHGSQPPPTWSQSWRRWRT